MGGAAGLRRLHQGRQPGLPSRGHRHRLVEHDRHRHGQPLCAPPPCPYLLLPPCRPLVRSLYVAPCCPLLFSCLLPPPPTPPTWPASVRPPPCPYLSPPANDVMILSCDDSLLRCLSCLLLPPPCPHRHGQHLCALPRASRHSLMCFSKRRSCSKIAVGTPQPLRPPRRGSLPGPARRRAQHCKNGSAAEHVCPGVFPANKNQRRIATETGCGQLENEGSYCVVVRPGTPPPPPPPPPPGVCLTWAVCFSCKTI